MSKKEVSIEKKEYIVKNRLFGQLEPVIDVLLNLEDSVVKECDKEGIAAEHVLRWIVDQLPCVEFSSVSSSYVLKSEDDEEEDIED